jgi:hypothetical protein
MRNLHLACPPAMPITRQPSTFFAICTVLLQCCYSAVTVLSQCCSSVVTVLLQCCHSDADHTAPQHILRNLHNVVTVLLQCCHSVVAVLSQCCYSVVSAMLVTRHPSTYFAIHTDMVLVWCKYGVVWRWVGVTMVSVWWKYHKESKHVLRHLHRDTNV